MLEQVIHIVATLVGVVEFGKYMRLRPIQKFHCIVMTLFMNFVKVT